MKNLPLIRSCVIGIVDIDSDFKGEEE